MDYYLKCYDLFIFSSFLGGGGGGGGGWGGGGGVVKHPVYEHSPWIGVLTDADPENHDVLAKFIYPFLLSVLFQ